MVQLEPTTGKIIEANEAASSFYGWNHEELLEKSILEINTLSNAEVIEEMNKAVLEQQNYFQFQHRLSNGMIRDVEVYSVPIQDKGKPFLYSIIHDVTDRKRMEEALREERDFSTSLVDTAQTIILVLDTEGRIMRINPYLEEISGYTMEEVLGKDWVSTFLPDSDHNEIRSLFQKSVANSTIGKNRNSILTKEGHERQIQWHNKTLRTQHGEVIGMLSVGQDVTDQVKAEQDLFNLNEELEQRVLNRTLELEVSNKQLEAFSYSVSHDLRTPLSHISGFAGMLNQRLGPKLDEKSQRQLGHIMDAANQMSNLIHDLLNFSRISQTEMVKTEINLEDTIHQVQRDLWFEIENRNIIWQLDKLEPVYGDPPLIQQIMVNLLSNAIKFSSNRDPAIIEISCKKENEETTVCVRDNGIGFDMKYVDKLFGVFQRLHHEEEYEGTGIGLANVRRIVNRHGGRTWAESSPDNGASFYFSLPNLKKEDKCE